MATGDLTTLATVKLWLGIPVSNTDDDGLLTSLVSAASQFIQTWLDRQLLQQTYTETRDGNGGQRLLFLNYPVSAVSALTINNNVIPSASDALSWGYSFTPTEIRLNGGCFTHGFSNVAISYTGGYAVAPSDVAQAATQLVALRYRERDRIGHASKSVGGETVNFTVTDMPIDVRTLLARFRRVVPV